MRPRRLGTRRKPWVPSMPVTAASKASTWSGWMSMKKKAGACSGTRSPISWLRLPSIRATATSTEMPRAERHHHPWRRGAGPVDVGHRQAPFGARQAADAARRRHQAAGPGAQRRQGGQGAAHEPIGESAVRGGDDGQRGERQDAHHHRQQVKPARPSTGRRHPVAEQAGGGDAVSPRQGPQREDQRREHSEQSAYGQGLGIDIYARRHRQPGRGRPQTGRRHRGPENQPGPDAGHGQDHDL